MCEALSLLHGTVCGELSTESTLFVSRTNCQLQLFVAAKVSKVRYGAQNIAFWWNRMSHPILWDIQPTILFMFFCICYMVWSNPPWTFSFLSDMPRCWTAVLWDYCRIKSLSAPKPMKWIASTFKRICCLIVSHLETPTIVLWWVSINLVNYVPSGKKSTKGDSYPLAAQWCSLYVCPQHICVRASEARLLLSRL